MSVYQYDILKDTWIYAEIKQQVQEEEHSEQVQEYRQMLQAIVQARFPRLESLAKEVSDALTSPAALRDLIVKVSTAKIEKVVRQYLIEEKKRASEEIA
jgi:excinuclease UvrABC nuclease subunit